MGWLKLNSSPYDVVNHREDEHGGQDRTGRSAHGASFLGSIAADLRAGGHGDTTVSGACLVRPISFIAKRGTGSMRMTRFSSLDPGRSLRGTW